MAVRRFTSVDSDLIRLAVGAIEGAQGGPITFAVIAKVEIDNSFTPFMSLAAPTTVRRAWWRRETNLLHFESGGFAVSNTVNQLTIADGWALVIFTKADGTATPRVHIFYFGTSTWVHEDFNGTLDNDGTALDRLELGWHESSSSGYDGLMALAAIRKEVIGNDAAIEAFGLEDFLENWRAIRWDGVWPMNQALTGASVTDLTGLGSDQSAIQGTSVVTGDDPAFSFDGMLLNDWGQSTWNSTTGLTLFGLQDLTGKRLVLVGVDRSGGQTATLSGTDAGLITALGSPIVTRVTDPTNGSTRRSVYMWTCEIPSVGANPIVAVDIRDGSNVEVEGTVHAWAVDIDSSYQLSAVGSADSGGSTVTAQSTGVTPEASAGDHVVAAAAVIRGDSIPLSDAYNDTNGTLLAAHTPGVGSAAVALDFNIDGGVPASDAEINNNTLRSTGTVGTTDAQSPVHRYPADPGLDEYDAQVQMRFFGTAQGQRKHFLAVRMTPTGTAHSAVDYYGIIGDGGAAQEWLLVKNVAGTVTVLDSMPATLADTSFTVRVEVRSGAISVFANDVRVLYSEDTDIIQRGRVGVASSRGGDTLAHFMDNLSITPFDDWTDADKSPWGRFDLETPSGTGANQRRVIAGTAFHPGAIAQTYEDTLNLGLARMVSAVIAVFSTGGGIPTVALSPGILEFQAVPLDPQPGMVTITLSPGVLTFTPVALDPQPGVVTIELSPGVLTFQAISMTPLAGASVMLSPGVLTFQAVPLTYQPGMVTIELSPGILTFVAVPIGQIGAAVDVNVSIAPSRIGSMLVAQSRANGMSVGQTREARGN